MRQTISIKIVSVGFYTRHTTYTTPRICFIISRGHGPTTSPVAAYVPLEHRTSFAIIIVVIMRRRNKYIHNTRVQYEVKPRRINDARYVEQYITLDLGIATGTLRFRRAFIFIPSFCVVVILRGVVVVGAPFAIRPSAVRGVLRVLYTKRESYICIYVYILANERPHRAHINA